MGSLPCRWTREVGQSGRSVWTWSSACVGWQRAVAMPEKKAVAATMMTKRDDNDADHAGWERCLQEWERVDGLVDDRTQLVAQLHLAEACRVQLRHQRLLRQFELGGRCRGRECMPQCTNQPNNQSTHHFGRVRGIHTEARVNVGQLRLKPRQCGELLEGEERLLDKGLDISCLDADAVEQHVVREVELGRESVGLARKHLAHLEAVGCGVVRWAWWVRWVRWV